VKSNPEPSPENPLDEAVRIALTNPNWFADKILNCPNDSWQAEIMDAIADLDRARQGMPTLYNHDLKNKFSIVAGHGPGKTHLGAKVMHWFNFTRRAIIPCTAPKEKQLTTRLWPEFRRILQRGIKEYRDLILVEAMKIVWGNDPLWFATIEAASMPENLAGYHDDMVLFIVDEASGIKEEMFPVIMGALTTEGSVLLMYGNPTKLTGEFYASHNKRGVMEDYYLRHVKPEESPHVSQKWVDGLVRRYGRDHPVVKVRAFGEFAEMMENQLIPLAWIERARDTSFTTDGSLPRMRISVDVADGGEDETVVTVARMFDTATLFLEQKRFNFEPSVSPIESGEAALRIYQAWGCTPKNGDDFVVDAIGVGAGTAGWLMKQGMPVIAYKGGEASDDTAKWRNRRTQSYIVMRDGFRDEAIFIADDFTADWDDFTAQMCSIKSKPGTERLEELQTKEEMKRSGIKSPDMADSPAMVFATKQPSMTGRLGSIITTPGLGARQ